MTFDCFHPENVGVILILINTHEYSLLPKLGGKVGKILTGLSSDPLTDTPVDDQVYEELFDHNICWFHWPSCIFNLSNFLTICVKAASLGDFLLLNRGCFDTAAFKLLLCLAASFLSSLSQVVDTIKHLKYSPSYVLICFYLICSCTSWTSSLAGDF